LFNNDIVTDKNLYCYRAYSFTCVCGYVFAVVVEAYVSLLLHILQG
jgi:hypothetical protein